MPEELYKFVGTLVVSVLGAWVTLHRRLENISARMKSAEDEIKEIKQQHSEDTQAWDKKHERYENLLQELRAQHAATSADMRNLITNMAEMRSDIKTLLTKVKWNEHYGRQGPATLNGKQIATTDDITAAVAKVQGLKKTVADLATGADSAAIIATVNEILAALREAGVLS